MNAFRWTTFAQGHRLEEIQNYRCLHYEGFDEVDSMDPITLSCGIEGRSIMLIYTC